MNETTHIPKSGLVTLLNSKQAKIPPGFNTRYASFRTSAGDVQFLIPKAMVYKSYVLSGNLSAGRACALPTVKLT